MPQDSLNQFPGCSSGANICKWSRCKDCGCSKLCGRGADAKNVVEQASAKVLLPSTSNRGACARNVAAAAYAKGKNALLA